jgi:hypothetical protein
MADDYGIDLSKVFIPITGMIGVADYGVELPTPAAGGELEYTVPDAFKRPGLLTEDGGFDWTLERDGDPIKFFQSGYSLPSGVANAELVVKFAQTDSIVRRIVHGQTPDANGYIEIDAGGHDLRFSIFTAEIAKNGWIRRRIAANATVKGAKEDKAENGAVKGYEVTFTIERDAKLRNKHLGEWLIPPAASTLAVVTAATPTEAAAGAEVTITGTGFLGATRVKFGAANAAGTSDVISDTEIRAVVPPGAAGSAAIAVVNAVGTSTAFPYTRG